MVTYGVLGLVAVLVKQQDQISAENEDLGENMVDWAGKTKVFLLRWIFQWSAIQLRKSNEDVRLCKDSRGNLTFQGEFKYVGECDIPKRRSE